MDSDGIPQGVGLVGHHPVVLTGNVGLQMPVVSPMVDNNEGHLYSVGTHIDPMSTIRTSHQYITHPHHSVQVENQSNNEIDSQTYDDIFPALPQSYSNIQSNRLEVNGKQKNKIKPTNVAQLFTVAPEERKYKEQNVFGESDQAKIIMEIMRQTGTKIEMSNSKDGKLTFLISGKELAVSNAKKAISSAVLTKAEKSISIPKEHHKFILGKSGKKLLDLEAMTNTKITVPRPTELSDVIKIQGTKDGVEKAVNEILFVSYEAVNRANERINIPKEYHPFILGPFNETLNQIMNETGAKINIPPSNLNKEDISITGEVNAVAAAKARINEIYEDKKAKCATQSMEMKKSRHKYIIGPKGQILQEIFKQTGVYVEMPPLDSSVDTITLRGEQDKIGPALTVLYEKAHSVSDESIDAEPWIHRYILGPKGANFQEIHQHFPEVHVSFKNEGKIEIHGPRNEVQIAKKILFDKMEEIKKRVNIVEMKIEPKYHRFIIGKNGAVIKQIREATKAQIHVPNDSDTNASSDIIRLEGSAEAVKLAQEQLEAIISKQKERENEIVKELIIDQRFHKQFIGSKGEKIREIRDKFNQVAINFPDSSVKSDKVVIRGTKEDVEKCYKHLAQLNKELLASNYRVEVPILKQFHILIGNQRGKLIKIRTDTDTKIDIPPNNGNNESGVIVITGKKESVEKAKEQIEKIKHELANFIQCDIIIPAKLHNSLIGAKGRLIKSISEECRGVVIKFPNEGSGSDKVTIIGTKEMVNKAKQQLIELKNERLENSYTVEIKAKPEYHRFLIGKDGLNIKKVKEKTGVRILFPIPGEESPSDRETISIIGKEKNVLQAKAELLEMIEDLEKTVEEEIVIPSKYHSYFKRIFLKQIKSDLTNININFSRNQNDEKIILKGSKDCVETAKSRIEDKIEELEAQVTLEVVIPQESHKFVMGKKGSNVKAIQEKFNVDIQFPKRETNGFQSDVHEVINGNIHEGGDEVDIGSRDTLKASEDIVIVKGRKENCENAKEALLASIPVVQEIEVPFIYHKFIIGPKGKDITDLNELWGVSITVPRSSEQSNIIKVQGLEANVEKAIQAIKERNYRAEIKVDPIHHPKIIGKKGSVISKVRNNHNVQIQFPERNNDTNQIDQDTIVIIGVEKDVLNAKEEIMKLVHHLENMVTDEIEIDNKVHSRLIGQYGKNIRKIMDNFKVDVKFPKENSNNPDLVIITGEREDVDECKKHLLNLAEEYLDDSLDMYIHSNVQSKKQSEDNENRPRGENKGFYVKGGPWELQSGHQIMPDTNNTEEFPSMCNAEAGLPEAPKMGWGLGVRVASNSGNNN